MVPEEGFFVAKLMCSMRIDFDIAKEQQIKMSLLQFQNICRNTSVHTSKRKNRNMTNYLVGKKS